MKRIIYSLFLAILLATSAAATAQEPDNRLFPYPTIPDSKQVLSERCNYLVYHFWDRANIKQSFSTISRLNAAFGDWVSFMPYATADTVHLAIDNYIKKVQKTGWKNTLEMGRMARGWLATDTAEYASEELYEPFCAAVAGTKKIPNKDRQPFVNELRRLQSTQVGMRIPEFDYVTPTGEKRNTTDIRVQNIILMFVSPDCIDCLMTRSRFAADRHTQSLIDRQLLKIVAIYPDEPTDEWREAMATYPKDWEIGAAPDAKQYFEVEELPNLYYLNSRHKIIGKRLIADNILQAIALMDEQLKQQSAE